MKRMGTYGIAFLYGFFLYALMEILSRGYTHWTMAVTGGIVLMVLYRMERTLQPTPFWVRAALGALFITAMEFSVGIVDNLIMGWGVWDYSSVRGNLLGQICLPYSALWFLLCLPAGLLCRGIQRRYADTVSA